MSAKQPLSSWSKIRMCQTISLATSPVSVIAQKNVLAAPFNLNCTDKARYRILAMATSCAGSHLNTCFGTCNLGDRGVRGTASKSQAG
jgi:hypothetical protein